ncbi:MULTISPECIES: DUF983 domain-containing protein [unclassified Roseitalea]|uniref:DUF983 domain-containing protein n=1 Tax=unclassified Roseitalea TaxID=2639107 RepID=UPI00273D9A60|nr:MULTISPECIES: DUF983 domain-containing protein [unclassified Roseitalea]
MSESFQPQTFGGNRTHRRRPLWTAMARGAAGRCPNCARGPLFARFSKSVEHCAVCDEAIHHHRADDLPAYLNVFIVGHVVIAGFVIVERVTQWSSFAHLALWLPLTIAMSLMLLQPIKGAVIGLQWANFMHGFGGEEDAVADPDIDPASHG